MRVRARSAGMWPGRRCRSLIGPMGEPGRNWLRGRVAAADGTGMQGLPVRGTPVPGIRRPIGSLVRRRKATGGGSRAGVAPARDPRRSAPTAGRLLLPGRRVPACEGAPGGPREVVGCSLPGPLHPPAEGPRSAGWGLFFGPSKRSTGLGGATLRCETCKADFQPRHPRARFCSGRCRVAAWKRRREAAARAPLERALRDLLERLEEALEAAREVLTGREKP